MTLTTSYTKMCYEVHGGTCKNKVSEANGFICSANHHQNSTKLLHQDVLLASSPSSSPRLLDALVKTPNQHQTIKIKVIENPNAMIGTIGHLLCDNDAYVRAYVAHSPRLPYKLQESAMFDPSPVVRGALASNVNLDMRCLLVLANDEEACVRAKLAANRKLPTATGRELARDSEAEVRLALSASSFSDLQTVIKLARDEVSYVRGAIGGNKSLDLIEELLSHNVFLDYEPYNSLTYRLAEIVDNHEVSDSYMGKIRELMVYCYKNSLNLGGSVDHSIHGVVANKIEI